LFRQKSLNKSGDAVAFLFERKMTGVEQVEFDIFLFAIARFRLSHNAVAGTTALCAAGAFKQSLQAGL
jgi:hypothetical protein